MIQFGLRLHDAEKLPVEQVLPLVRQKGFTCAHHFNHFFFPLI